MRKFLLLAAAAVLLGAPAHADTQAQDYARERALSGHQGNGGPATIRSLSPRRATSPLTIRSWAPRARAFDAPHTDDFSGSYRRSYPEHAR